MFTRREFIRIGAVCGAGLMIFNPYGFTGTAIPEKHTYRSRKLLYGNPRNGCSTSRLTPEFIPDINSGVKSFEECAFLIQNHNGGYC